MRELTREALDERLLAWTGGEPGEAFEDIILDVFRFQYRHNAMYRRWSERENTSPETLADWRDIPAVPQAAFKEWTLATFDEESAVARFDSSGTTTGRPSRHYFDTLALYDAAVVPPFKQYVLPDGAEPRSLALVPHPTTAPHSSLAHMAGVVASQCCRNEVDYFVRAGSVDVTAFLDACRGAAGPVLIFTTAFALVHVLDTMERSDITIEPPQGSRIMETGGYKGRTREMPRDELYAWARSRLSIRESHIINEYGMAELSSQWYDTIFADAIAGAEPGRRTKAGPPWTRVRIINPRTGSDADKGEVGLIRVYDAMNRGSVCCVQTEDLGRRLDDGFEVLGRAGEAELRGCSLELDTF